MRILAIGAHADDVELGCGASLLRWAREGHEITLYTATDSAYAAPDGRLVRSAEDAAREAAESARRLGARLLTGPFKTFGLSFAAPLNDALVQVFEEVRPDLALVHWSGDTHADHHALALSVQHACRHCPSLLGYASNWYQGAERFDPRLMIDVTDTLDGKLDLIALFESENQRTKGAWQAHMRDQAAVLGRQAGVRYAEGFQVIKYRL